MPDFFQEQGRTLLSNGYLIIPIKPGHKRPALSNWQSVRLGAQDLSRYPGCGVGVLCGQGAHPLAALDIDTTDARLVERFVDWCMHNLGVTCERVGNAPKLLLVYRAQSADWGKATGAWFADSAGGRHRLEVLGRGQQFVAYHVHPDTGKPYAWVDLFGGIEAMRAVDLPVISQQQVEQALQAFARLAQEAGLEPVAGSSPHAGGPVAVDDDPLMAYEPPIGLTLEQARERLAFVDNTDYDTWLRVGMSLHHEFAACAEALALWDEWSQGAAQYRGTDDLEHRWHGFGRTGNRPTTARWLVKVGNAGERQVAREQKRTSLAELKAEIAACTDSIDLVNDIAVSAGAFAEGDKAVQAELTGLIRARFKALTGTVLPLADARAALSRERKATPIGQQTRPMTEFGNAERMLDHYAEGLMYVPEAASWYIWTGIYWRRAEIVEMEHLAKETVKALADESKEIDNDDTRAAFLKFCAASQRANMVRNMVSLAQSDPRVVVGMADLDSRPHLLGVGNGAVDLRSGQLLPPDQAYRITTITETDYDPHAACPLFEQTVNDVFFGDEEMVGFFRRLIGYALLAQPTEDILAIPYGMGSNGKSTVLGAVRQALGRHARMASADTFLSSGAAGGNAGGAREDVLRLRGARFVYVSEPDEGSELREGLIKSMTGGEVMPARGLYSKTTVEVLPTWVAFMPTNHRPIVKGDDHAIWRRLLPVPFTRNFDQDKAIAKDPDRADKLAAEAQGILAWCVRGALEYQEQGLRPPAAVQQARDEYRTDMDLLAEWLEECCELGPNLVESNARLWASWEAFARSRGELRYISNSKALGRRLAGRFMPVKDCVGLQGRGLRGLAVKRVGDFE